MAVGELLTREGSISVLVVCSMLVLVVWGQYIGVSGLWWEMGDHVVKAGRDAVILWWR